jgi:hypothetical protein
MASVLDQLPNSTLSLQGNNLTANPNSPAWGFKTTTRGGTLDPYLSQLHYQPLLQNGYSVDGTPGERIVDFNGMANHGLSLLGPPSTLDELDRNAPRNYQVAPPRGGQKGSVVSQIYKSPQGRQYTQLGPQPGFY